MLQVGPELPFAIKEGD